MKVCPQSLPNIPEARGVGGYVHQEEVCKVPNTSPYHLVKED
eukprot:CAMPEP_0184306812 /NCGR_PEP_ID=MMETSP1049-20130417/15713_1 /TAXON_ID=77928 /ORGANISM="Proteomonas sulcata, Strain CCMP704" /LENGTH=41 /DNA_ID= /DNA_START= /DNA_END= /DNA_ORIENTATION=